MAEDGLNSFMTGPDEAGRFGIFGGRFVSETLMPLILDLEERYNHAKTDPTFWAEMDDLWKHYIGRPSPPQLCFSPCRGRRADFPQLTGVVVAHYSQAAAPAGPSPAPHP